MTSTRLLTKQDLLDLIEEVFPDARPTERVAVMLAIKEDDCTNQCILLTREVRI